MEHILNHEKAHQKYFEEMTAIPHGSYHEQAYSAYLVAFAKEHGLKWIQDELYNVIIYKDASAGYEDHAPVLLQAHTDMVCEKNKDTDFDFEKDALKLYIEDGFLKARGTTLGADDGVGPQGLAARLGLDLDGIAAPALAQVLDGAAGAHLDAQSRQMVLQQGQYVRRLIGIRVHPPGLVGAWVEAEAFEPCQRRSLVHGAQQAAQGLGAAGEVPLRCDVPVVEIAAPVAGGQKLFAHLRVFVQHGDVCAALCGLCCRQRSGQTGCAAAQNQNLLHPLPILSVVNLLYHSRPCLANTGRSGVYFPAAST